MEYSAPTQLQKANKAQRRGELNGHMGEDARLRGMQARRKNVAENQVR